jgi:hypothetical protein
VSVVDTLQQTLGEGNGQSSERRSQKESCELRNLPIEHVNRWPAGKAALRRMPAAELRPLGRCGFEIWLSGVFRVGVALPDQPLGEIGLKTWTQIGAPQGESCV